MDRFVWPLFRFNFFKEVSKTKKWPFSKVIPKGHIYSGSSRKSIIFEIRVVDFFLETSTFFALSIKLWRISEHGHPPRNCHHLLKIHKGVLWWFFKWLQSIKWGRITIQKWFQIFRPTPKKKVMVQFRTIFIFRCIFKEKKRI